MGGGRGSHQSTGSSSAAYGRGATGVFNNTTTTNGGSHMSPSPHLGQPVFGQNGFTPGYGAQPRVANGYGGSASTAAVAQKSGAIPLRQPSHGNLHGLINRPIALQFKSSPFHRVEQMLGNYKVLEGQLEMQRECACYFYSRPWNMS